MYLLEHFDSFSALQIITSELKCEREKCVDGGRTLLQIA